MKNTDVIRLDSFPYLLSERNATCFFGVDHPVRVVQNEDTVVVQETLVILNEHFALRFVWQ